MSRVMTGRRIAAFVSVAAAIAALVGLSVLRGEAPAALISAQARAQGAVFLLTDGQPHLLALRLEDGEPFGQIELDRAPDIIAPTPGGVSIFLGWNDRQTLEVFDVLTLDHQATLDSGEPAPAAVSFSPTGERLYVVGSDGRSLSVLAHARLSLEPAGHYTVAPGSEAILANRRATRLFRPTTNGLDVHFAQNGRLLDRFEARGHGWRFDRDQVELWGVNPDGRPVVIDERSGQTHMLDGVTVSGQPPVVNNRISYLSADGREIVSFNPRAARRRPQRVALPAGAAFLVVAGPDEVWAVSEGGVITMVQAGEVRATHELENSGMAPIRRAVSAVVQQGGGFACFD